MTDKHITLTVTVKEDLNALYQFQLNEEAGFLAAFTPADRYNETAYIERYSKYLTDPKINMRTIRYGNEVVGSIAKYVMEGDAEITYWIDRKFWGQGIGTAALSSFLQIEKTRPLFARVAFDNNGSQKVLEKCGFVGIGKDKGFANARQAEIEEYIYQLGPAE
jgi:[ribosomal protein S5]-alanine N-acetyltransferase